MTSRPFALRNARLSQDYSMLALRWGNDPRSSQWRDLPAQNKRIEILLGIDDLSHAKILDFGCGTGQGYEVLTRTFDFRGEYVGWDISGASLGVARSRFPKVRFEQVDIFAGNIKERFDYVLVSGVFNNQVGDAKSFFEASLARLFSLCHKGIAFNALSSEFADQVTGLYYMDPVAIFDMVRAEFSPFVTLRQDYRVRSEPVPSEFTLYLRQIEAVAASGQKTPI